MLMEVTGYEEEESGVSIHFNDGRPAEHARFVIGADGFFSKIRKQCLDDGPPDFTVCSYTNTLWQCWR